MLSSPARQFLFVALLLAALVCPSPPAHARKANKLEATVEALMAANSEDDKAHILMRMRNNLAAPDLLKLVGSESSFAIDAMAVGCYLEGSRANSAEAAEILWLLAQRMNSCGQAATLGATSGKAVAIAETLTSMPSRPKAASPSRLAAEMLATYATICEEGIVAKGGRRARRRGDAVAIGQNAAAAAAVLGRLLKSKDPEVVECAILAAARLRLPDLRQAIAASGEVRSPAIIAARVLYLAKIGDPIPEAAIKKVFAPDSKTVLARGAKLPPLLSYAIRMPALTYGCQALGELHDAKYVEYLNQAIQDIDSRVQIDAARAMEQIASEHSLPALLERVASRQTSWPVLVHVLSAVGAIPSKDSIPVLISRLAKEKGRFSMDVIYALSSIAGQQKAMDAADWGKWWEANQATFVADKQRTAKFRQEKEIQDMRMPGGVVFYDLNIISRNVVFIIDTSNSMRGTKLDSAKTNLTRTLQTLDDGVRFNVVNFGGIVHILKPTGLITHDEIAETINEVKYLDTTGGTRTFDAIELAMTQPGMDTAIVLTDGAPVAGKFCAWPRLTGALGILSRYYPVAIWGLQFDAAAGNLAAMEEMTNRHWGRTGSPQP